MEPASVLDQGAKARAVCSSEQRPSTPPRHGLAAAEFRCETQGFARAMRTETSFTGRTEPAGVGSSTVRVRVSSKALGEFPAVARFAR